jgi:hypothetical protein
LKIPFKPSVRSPDQQPYSNEHVLLVAPVVYDAFRYVRVQQGVLKAISNVILQISRILSSIEAVSQNGRDIFDDFVLLRKNTLRAALEYIPMLHVRWSIDDILNVISSTIARFNMEMVTPGEFREYFFRDFVLCDQDVLNDMDDIERLKRFACYDVLLVQLNNLKIRFEELIELQCKVKNGGLRRVCAAMKRRELSERDMISLTEARRELSGRFCELFEGKTFVHLDSEIAGLLLDV